MIDYKIQFQKDVPGRLDWLHPSELDLFRAFRFEKRQNDWLLGRWTAKNLLQERWYQEKDLNDLAVLPGENRAPFVYVDGEQQAIIISISHGHGQSFCVTSEESVPVGCDLEKVEKRSKAFLMDYFGEDEHQLFISNNHELEEEEYFTLLWTAKEALMKATRKGMSLHPLKIKISDVLRSKNDWNTLELCDLSCKQMFKGSWQRNGAMIYTVVSDKDFVLSRRIQE